MELPRDVARYQAALPRTRRGVTRHGVDQHSDARGQPGITALSQNSGHRPGEHVSGPGARHTRVASLAERRYAALGANERSRALQHHGTAVSCDQPIERGQPVRLYLFRADVEKTTRLARMRSQDPVVSR